MVLCGGQLKLRSTEVCFRSRNPTPSVSSLPIICGLQEDGGVFRLPSGCLGLDWTGTTKRSHTLPKARCLDFARHHFHHHQQ